MTMTDIATLSVDIPSGSALVTPFGAHLLSWRPAGYSDILWLSSRAVMDGTRAIRGGIPLCLPWFGSPADSPAAPGAGAGAHGFARTSRWSLLAQTTPADASPATVSFERHHTGETSLLYPHSFCARLDVVVGAELHLNLTLINEDDHPFTIEAAMHTYLRVGDVKDLSIEGLDGAPYYDKIKERRGTQCGDLAAVGPLDRIYTTTQPVHVVDPRLGRRIIIDKSGSGSTIVWNPWAQAAASMTDVGEGEWQHFVCVETAAVRERALTLRPGHPHIMTQTLAVETLE